MAQSQDLQPQDLSQQRKLAASRIREKEKEGEARRRIATVLVYGFMGVTLLNIIGPVLIVKFVGPSTGTVAALKSISEGMTPIVSSIVGVLGFVLGYYFKSEEGG